MDKIIELSSLQHINLLVTSRKLHDIAKKLDNRIDIKVDLKGPGNAADICLHVRKSLDRDQRLGKWPEALKAKIQETLEANADGM